MAIMNFANDRRANTSQPLILLLQPCVGLQGPMSASLLGHAALGITVRHIQTGSRRTLVRALMLT